MNDNQLQTFNSTREIEKITEIFNKDHTKFISDNIFFEKLLKNIEEEDKKIIINNSHILWLYASLEGIIKNTTDEVLKFIKKYKENNKDCILNNNFNIIFFHNKAINMKDKNLQEFGISNKQDYRDNSKKFSNSFYSCSYFDVKGTILDVSSLKINTQSNMKFNIFISILNILNIKIEKYLKFTNQNTNGEVEVEKYFNLLVENRNKIAHGDIKYLRNPPKDENMKYYKETVKYILEIFTHDVSDLLIQKKFLEKDYI